MDNEIFKSYYAIIPANVRYDKDLSANAKLLYGEITALCNEKGYCFASNAYFAKLYNVEDRTVRRWISCLVKKGYIKSEKVIEESADIVQILKNKNMEEMGYGENICEWCKVKTTTLHFHHYPIPKSKGGTEGVFICPNCHHEFHSNDLARYLKLNVSQEEMQYINNIKGGR